MARRITSGSLVLFVGSLILFTSAPSATAAGGDLDPTFGGNGKVVTHIPQSNEAAATGVAIQADRKIVAAGYFLAGAQNEVEGFAIARYDQDGSLDTTFGTGGLVQTVFPSFLANALDVAIQADGKIVAAGAVFLANHEDGFAIARYNQSGTLDTTFSGDGLQTTRISTPGGRALGASANAVALQGDGKIVLTGPSGDSASVVLVRYNSDGTLDTTFSGNGKMATSFHNSQTFHVAEDVAIQTNGAIVVVGYGGRLPFKTLLARFLPDGSLDKTFSSNGRKLVDFGSNSFADGVAIQQDGKIVAVGGIRWGVLGGGLDFSLYRWGVVRVNKNGSLDPTFGRDGLVRFWFYRHLNARAEAVAIQSDGKIVVAGESERRLTDSFDDFMFDVGLARLRTDGTLDPSFGGDGKVRTRIGSTVTAADVAIADGKIVTAGGTATPFGVLQDFAVARYEVR